LIPLNGRVVCSLPGRYSSVLPSATATPVPPAADMLCLSALDNVAAAQIAAGQNTYAPPEQRLGLFASSTPLRARALLRTAQYDSPTVGPSLSIHPSNAAAAAAPAAAEESGMAARVATPSPEPKRSGKPRPRPKTQARYGTFSNMMTSSSQEGDTTSAGLSIPAPHSTNALGAGADVMAGGNGNYDLASMLFGDVKPERPKREAASAASAEPLVDLLGVVGGLAQSDGEAEVEGLLGHNGVLDDLDLLGTGSHAPAGNPQAPTHDPFATHAQDAGALGSQDLLPDLMSEVSGTMTPAECHPSFSAKVPHAPAVTVNSATPVIGGSWLGGRSDAVHMPAVPAAPAGADAGSLLSDFGLAPAAAAPVTKGVSGGMVEMHEQGQNNVGNAAPSAQSRQGSLPSKPPQKKGDAFSDLLSF
jgi:hypothetical protein